MLGPVGTNGPEIIAWQKAKELNLLIYKIFDKSRDYGFKEQTQHASFSIYKPLTS